MTGYPEPSRSPGTRRDHRFYDGVDTPGFPLIPLTTRKCRHIVTTRKADNSIREKRAGTPRLALICAETPDVSPVARGGNPMSCDHGAFVRSRAGRLRQAMQLASGFLALALATTLWFGGAVQAQETQIIHPGSMAVTGFSGTVIPDFEQVSNFAEDPNFEEGLPPGVEPVDETFIDTTRATLRVFDVSRLGGPASGQLVFTPPPFEVTAGQIGQVFAITYDDGVRDGAPSGIPNLYAGATSLHGIRIVTSDEDADGRPERQLSLIHI